MEKKLYSPYELAILCTLYTVPLHSVWPTQAKRWGTHGKRTCRNWKSLKCESSTVLQENSHEKRDSLATDYSVLLSRLSTYRLLGRCLSREALSAEGVLTSCQLLQADTSKEEWAVIFFSRQQKTVRLNHVYDLKECQECQT